MRTLISLMFVVIIAGVSACASNKPASTTPTPQPTAAPEPVKPQEASPQQRAAIKTELAAGYYERGQFDTAITILDESTKLDPNHPKTYDIYGLVYTMLGETQKAEASFTRALQLAPRDPEIRANWGAFLCTSGRVKESIPEFEAALADPLFKKPEVALINAGKCSVALGDTQRADDYFRRALSVSPGNPTASYQLALIAYNASRLDEARGWLRPVMQQGAPRPEALYLGMCIERKKGDQQAELSYTSQLRNRFPDSPEARAIAGGTCG